MKILFIHQNFPGQFKFLAPALAEKGHEVHAMTLQPVQVNEWQGVHLHPYGTSRSTTSGIHPWLGDFETKLIRGDACFQAASKLRDEGFHPDIIVAHPGWGESMFLKKLWPAAKLGIYCEFFYQAEGADIGFDPEFPVKDNSEACRIQLKNLNNLLHFSVADAGLSPTFWQASTFPEAFRSKISVIHDGIDTDLVAPNPSVKLTLNGDLTLSKGDEIVTFVNRNLEPYRGYHIFMRALPSLLKERPNAHILIIGGDGVSYGGAAPQGRKWKDVYVEEVRSKISDEDWARVHFLGNVQYNHFIPLLQLSAVHVYWTYPFVLSWSLLEAMSAGCAIVASDTKPLHEAIMHEKTGQLVDFFDPLKLSEEVCALLDNPQRRAQLGSEARAFAKKNYDLKSVCLPKQLAWVESLAERPQL